MSSQEISIGGKTQLDGKKLKPGDTVVLQIVGRVKKAGREDLETTGVRDFADIKIKSLMWVEDEAQRNDLMEQIAAAQPEGDQQSLDTDAD